MADYHIPLHNDGIYHIFNRANGNDKLFRENENYHYFLKKYQQHISPIANTYGWCLLPNHFHFLVCIKPEIALKDHYEVSKGKQPETSEYLPDFIMERFSNLFNGYAKAFNKKYNRKGSLFMDFLRRVEILDNHQFLATLFYVHKNPVHHGFCKNIEDWKWASYHTFLSCKPTSVMRQEVLERFEGKDEFVKFHQQPIYLKDAVVIE